MCFGIVVGLFVDNDFKAVPEWNRVEDGIEIVVSVSPFSCHLKADVDFGIGEDNHACS